MIRTYYCPNCRATIYCSDRFCGNCGVSLKWVEAQILPADSNVPQRKPVDGQNEYRQQKDLCYQGKHKSSVPYSHNHLTQKTVSISPKKQSNGNTNSSQTAVRDKRKPEDNNDEQLKNDIAKLLESFREKVG